jgi:hypothetical protein
MTSSSSLHFGDKKDITQVLMSKKGLLAPPQSALRGSEISILGGIQREGE